MKPRNLHIAIMSALLLMSCANDRAGKKTAIPNNKAQVETVVEEVVEAVDEDSALDTLDSDTEIPEREKVPYLDDEKWEWTTLLYITPKETVFRVWQMDGLSYIVSNDNILYANPVMRTDSIAPTIRRISTFKGDVDIDFGRKGWRGKLAKLPHKLDSVTVFEHRYMRKGVDSVMRPEHDYFIRMEFPDSGRYSEKLNKWLVDRLCYEDGIFEETDEETGVKKHTHYYKGNMYDYQAIGKHLANQFFRDAPEFAITLNIYLTQDYRIFYKMPKYLTYQKYRYDFGGGVHGYYVEQLISYDTSIDQEIDNKLLFKPGTNQTIRNLIYEAAQTDSYFKKVYGERSIDEIKGIFSSDDNNENFEIPQAGVTPKGLMFSFQPYEIGGFAQGCFHILVPYEKAKFYLTDRGKSYFENR